MVVKTKTKGKKAVKKTTKAVKEKKTAKKPVTKVTAPEPVEVVLLKRSTVSLMGETIQLARRLCRAWEVHAERLPSIDEIVSDALELLVADYKKQGISIPTKIAAMRPGPKTREE